MGGLPTTEDEPVPSKIFAPSGLIPTSTEKEVEQQWEEFGEPERTTH